MRLPRQVPFAHAMEFLLCADRIDAQKALDMGLLNAVVAEDALLDKAFEYASRITKNAPLAVRATKRSVIEGLKLNMREAYRNEAAISKEIFSTEDAKEGPGRSQRSARRGGRAGNSSWLQSLTMTVRTPRLAVRSANASLTSSSATRRVKSLSSGNLPVAHRSSSRGSRGRARPSRTGTRSALWRP